MVLQLATYAHRQRRIRSHAALMIFNCCSAALRALSLLPPNLSGWRTSAQSRLLCPTSSLEVPTERPRSSKSLMHFWQTGFLPDWLPAEDAELPAYPFPPLSWMYGLNSSTYLSATIFAASEPSQ